VGVLVGCIPAFQNDLLINKSFYICFSYDCNVHELLVIMKILPN
jgi:hypothetical protein